MRGTDTIEFVRSTHFRFTLGGDFTNATMLTVRQCARACDMILSEPATGTDCAVAIAIACYYANDDPVMSTDRACARACARAYHISRARTTGTAVSRFHCTNDDPVMMSIVRACVRAYFSCQLNWDCAVARCDGSSNKAASASWHSRQIQRLH